MADTLTFAEVINRINLLDDCTPSQRKALLKIIAAAESKNTETSVYRRFNLENLGSTYSISFVLEGLDWNANQRLLFAMRPHFFVGKRGRIKACNHRNGAKTKALKWPLVYGFPTA